MAASLLACGGTEPPSGPPNERVASSTSPLVVGGPIPVPSGVTWFGQRVWLDGDNLAVLDKTHVGVYHLTGDTWALEGTFDRAQPGQGLSGDTLLNPPDVLVRGAGGTWTTQTTLTLPGAAYLGAVHGDRAALCGTQLGGTWGKVFTRTGGTWAETGAFTCKVGTSFFPGFAVATELDEDDLVSVSSTGVSSSNPATAPAAGVAVFREDAGGTWIGKQLPLPTPDSSDSQFGSGAWTAGLGFFGRFDLSGDWLAVGDPAAESRDSYSFDGPGAVYLYTHDASGGFVLTQTIHGLWRDDRYGNELAMGDGLLVVSAGKGDTWPLAHVYELSGGTWVERGLVAGSPRAASGSRVVMQEDATPWLGTSFDAPLRVHELRRPAGTSCGYGGECASGFCVDGVCCDSACGNGDPSDCRACSVTAGAVTDGTCGPAKAGHVCRPARDACDLAETCDGASSACPSVDVTVPDGAACSGSGVCSQGACKASLSGTTGEDVVIVPSALLSGTRPAATRDRLVTPSPTGFEVHDRLPSGWHRAADVRPPSASLAPTALAVADDTVLLSRVDGYGTVLTFQPQAGAWTLTKTDHGNPGGEGYPDSQYGESLALRAGIALIGDSRYAETAYKSIGKIQGVATGTVSNGFFGRDFAVDSTSEAVLTYEAGSAVIVEGASRQAVPVTYACTGRLQGRLAIRGDWAVVCDKVLHRDASVWAVTQTLPYATTVGLDATHLLVGTHVFELQGGSWAETGALAIRAPRAGSALEEDSTFVEGRAFVLGTYESAPALWVFTLATKAAQGTACTGSGECASGYCIDGVCCESACGGGTIADCSACSVAAGGTVDGTCGTLADGATCGAGTCKAGVCNGGTAGAGGAAGSAGSAGTAGAAGAGGTAGTAGAGGTAGAAGTGGTGGAGGIAGSAGVAGAAGAAGKGGTAGTAGAGGVGGAAGSAGAAGTAGTAGKGGAAGSAGASGAGTAGAAGAGAAGASGQGGAGGIAGSAQAGSSGKGGTSGSAGSAGHRLHPLVANGDLEGGCSVGSTRSVAPRPAALALSALALLALRRRRAPHPSRSRSGG